MTHEELLDTIMELIYEDNGGGICTVCLEIAYGVEPDAEGYECDACGALAVCGAEMYLLLNVA
jgi:hypothetical protein